MTLDHVFRAGAIGPLSLDHRIVMGSMHLGLESRDDDGRALAAFYAERARGGAGLIVTGGSAVSRVGAAGRGYSFVNEDEERSKLSRVADAVHEAGGRILLQLFHAGRYAIPEAFGLQPVAPSPVYSGLVRAEPRELTGAEVLQTIEDFAAGAARARELGFDGVEIMGSEGYLLNQFTAPLTNRRDDAWGGDRERRLAFPLAVSEAVRAAIGSDRTVVYRISAADLVEGGTPAEDVAELAARLADPDPDRPAVGTARGVDALNVGIGWHEARVPTVQQAVPEGAWVPWARELRRVAAVPVIASNRVNTLARAEEVLAARAADFVSLARPFLADPFIVAKGRRRSRSAGPAGHHTQPGRARDAERGPAEAVNVCIACDQACIDRSLFDQRVSCVVNPRAGFELELGPGADPDLAGRRVAVVGGGPAGMEAARALARAGAAVTLYEAGSRLGGQFRMAARIPGKRDYARTVEYFESELSRLGVVVLLETLPALEALRDADAVVLATGVTPRPVEIPGAELPHVHTYAELLDPDADPVALAPGAPVAIIGAGGIGVDVAHLLSDRETPEPVRRFYVEYALQPPAGPAIVPRTAPPMNGEDPGGPSSQPELAAAHPVTLMRRGSGRIGASIGPTSRWVTIGALRRAGVEMLTNVAYERIEPGAIHIRDADADGAARRIPAEAVILCAGQVPDDGLAGPLTAAGIPHLVIGGAAQAAELDAERAFRDGAEVPARVGALLQTG